MLFLHIVLTLICLFIIIVSCSFFTNAIEHLGKKLKWGSSAVGSVLAVIGTTLPETLVPIIAIIGSKFFLNNSQIGEEIAFGGIIGSPFMLVCLAMFLLGVELLILRFFKKRDTLELKINHKTVLRDYKYFLSAYLIAISCLFFESKLIKIFAVLLLVTIYCFYIHRTILKSKLCFCEECVDELLIIQKFKKLEKYRDFLIISQILFSLIVLSIAIHYFVCEIKHFSVLFNISPIILSLIITPFATELPECINSLIWVKNKKDDLALSNINGAIIFQSIIPMSLGILLTPFVYDKTIALCALFVIITTMILMAIINFVKKINCQTLLLCGIFYFLFICYLFLK